MDLNRNTFGILVYWLYFLTNALSEREDTPACEHLFDPVRECFVDYKVTLVVVLALVSENMPIDGKAVYEDLTATVRMCEQMADEYFDCCKKDLTCYLYDEYTQLADISSFEDDMHALTGMSFQEYFTAI